MVMAKIFCDSSEKERTYYVLYESERHFIIRWETEKTRGKALQNLL